MMLNKKQLHTQTIKLAARAARGDCLGHLYKRCDNQERVSSTVIERDLESVQEFLNDCALQMRKLLNAIGESND